MNLRPFLAGLTLTAALPNARADAPPFSVSIDAPAAQVGAPAQAHVKLVAAGGFHVNQEFPTSLKLTAPSGVELPKPTLTRKEGAKIEKMQALFDVAYTAREAGKKTFTGVLSFAVCTETTCDPHREKVSFTVDVK